MKILNLKSILFSLMAITMVTVFLTSCEKEEIVAEEQQIESTQNFSSEGMMLRGDCDKWLVPKDEHKLSSQKSLTLTIQTQAFKAPNTCAKRGFKYTTGTVVKASHKIGNFYWIIAPGYFSGADDTGWIEIPNSSTTGSTNTNTTNSTNSNFDCSKWLVPKDEDKLSSPKSLTLTTQTQAYKAPGTCAPRGFKYTAGTHVKASHKINNFYWITASGYFSGADDTGWIVIPNSGTTGSTNTNTNTTTNTNNNFDCSKWLVPQNEHRLSSPKQLTLNTQTQAYKAPGTCAKRGFKYSTGTVVKASHKINNFYWITAPGYFSGTDDNGWIEIPNTSTTGGSNTNTTSTNTNNTTGFEPKPENNPFICDGTSKTVGYFTGFMPGETVKVSWSSSKSSKKVADNNGKRSITWSCNNFSDLDLVAYGETSGRTFTYPFKTGVSGSTGGTSGGSTGGTNTNSSNCDKFTGNFRDGFPAYWASVGSDEGNAPVNTYHQPFDNWTYECRQENFKKNIEQGARVKVSAVAGSFVLTSEGWMRSSSVTQLPTGTITSSLVDPCEYRDYSNDFLNLIKKNKQLEGLASNFGGLEHVAYFIKLFKSDGPLDIKKTDEFLVDRSKCGVEFFGRDVSVDVPGNVLYGFFGYLYWKDHTLFNLNLPFVDDDLETFLIAAGGWYQATEDNHISKYDICLLADKTEWACVSTYDPACDSRAVLFGAYVAKQYGVDVTAQEFKNALKTEKGILYNPDFKCVNNNGAEVNSHPKGPKKSCTCKLGYIPFP